MGDFHPDAHVNGFAGSIIIALLCSKYCAIFEAMVSIRQKYEVFFNRRPAIITSNPDEGTDASLYFRFTGRLELLKILRLFEKHENIPSLTVYHSSFKELRKAFRSCFRVIKAAGGLVRNQQGDILFILRNGIWDLPKGKLERFENHQKGAIREVEEECGIKGLMNPQLLTTTFHVYRLNGKAVLKKTTWFTMEVDGMADLKPLIKEGITEVRWFAPSALQDPLANTYPNIQRVLQAAGVIKPKSQQD